MPCGPSCPLKETSREDGPLHERPHIDRAHLATTPFDLLKLDRSLVASVDSDTRARAVAAAIVALGSTLGLSVIAEGVERVEQLDELRDLGCHLAQGHLFGVAGALAS